MRKQLLKKRELTEKAHLKNKEDYSERGKNNRHRFRYATQFKVLTVLITLVFSFYVTELFLSLFFILPDPIANYYAFTPAKSGVDITVDQYEFKIGYKFNSQGFRDKEIPFKKNKDEKRILFLGDSTTEGFGTEEEERYSNLLIQKLGQNYSGINVGQLATNPNTYFDNLITFGMALKPDIVVMGISVSNDFMGGRDYKLLDTYNVNLQVPNKYLKKESMLRGFITMKHIHALIRQAQTKEKRLFRRGMEGNYWDLYFNEKITKSFYLKSTKLNETQFDEITQSFNQTLLPYFFEGKIIPTLLLESVNEKIPENKKEENYYNEDDYKNTLWFLKESNRLLKKNNVRLIVVVIPDVNQVHPIEFEKVLKDDFNFIKHPPRLAQLEEFRIRLNQDLQKSSIEFIDITDKLRESSELTYYLYDQHTNPRGHSIIADELVSLIKD